MARKTTTIQIRISPDFYDRFGESCEQQETTKSEFLTNFIKAYVAGLGCFTLPDCYADAETPRWRAELPGWYKPQFAEYVTPDGQGIRFRKGRLGMGGRYKIITL